MTPIVPTATLLLATGLPLPAAAGAPHADASEPAAAELPRRRRIGFPPLRVDLRAVVRPETNPTFLAEIGAQVIRGAHYQLEANVSFAEGRALGLTGPRRSMQSLDLTLDLTWSLGPWLQVGPSTGVAFRFFRQQWSSVDALWTPVAGFRLSTDVIDARTWSLQLTSKGMIDLIGTDLVRDTAEVRRLIPVEGQVGLRLNLGHGRVR